MDIAELILPNTVLQYSIEQQLTHIPSALSMLTYVDVLFTEKHVVPYKHKIVLGKPFGSQTYYLIWKRLNYIKHIENLSPGVKHAEIDFVDFGEETMGNALGVASGIAMTTSQKVWVNLSDATLQMGSTLEAIQYIGHKKLANIVVTVDYNNQQVTGKVGDILPVEPVINFFSNNGWATIVVDGHDHLKLNEEFRVKYGKPTVFFCKTIKGHGVPFMEADPVTWHYKKVDEKYLRQVS